MNTQPEPASFVGIGMTDKYAVPAATLPSFHSMMASMPHLMNAYEEALLGWHSKDAINATQFMKYFRKAADAVGYDLVPRLTAKEAHEFALAKGHAEGGPPPVTSAPGFDGRAKVVGPDDRTTDLSMGR